MKKMSRTDRYTDELRDPALAALLRETYAGDPALEASPGRTERIMRQVLAAAESQPRPARSPWLVWGWATGAVAAAALVAVLAVSLFHAPAPQVATVPTHGTVAPAHVVPLPVTPPRTPIAKAPVVVPAPQPAVHEPMPSPAPATPREQRPTNKTTRPAPAAPAQTSTEVAVALYTAGKTANDAGDYQGAYQAYQASYDAVPNPQTLLAASDALLKMEGEDAAPEG
jgi:hypothetical protein